MTREEAVKRIKEIQKLYVFTPTINEALDLAIEALRQTESEDCISRQQAVEAVTNTIREKFSLADWYEQLVETGLEIENLIKELQPVTPTERTGEWVSHELWDMPWFTCSECNYHGRSDFKFCPKLRSEDGR